MKKQIPIIFNHDYNDSPVGFLDGDGKINLNKDAGITPEQLVQAQIGYVAKKVVDGVIVEAELVELSLVVKL
jgi:hypothetical protein